MSRVDAGGLVLVLSLCLIVQNDIQNETSFVIQKTSASRCKSAFHIVLYKP